MSKHNNQLQVGYRRGVVLGLTIAEIILLILFALLLALTGVLMKKQAQIRAEMLSIVVPVVEEKKPEVVLDPAIYNVGVEFKKVFSSETPSEVSTLLKDSQSQIAKLKAELVKNGNTEVLPACYQKANDGRIPYIYDLRISNDGIEILNTLPERLRSRFSVDFKYQPPLNKVLSLQEFKLATNPFIVYGKSNQCKFYVKVYDETDKRERFKSTLKTVETNFVWTYIMGLKPGATAGEDLNLFTTTPVK